jgi:hypothetical protein
MANSTSNLDAISSSQAQKEVTANALFDAASAATTYGRRASTTTALTWGYYGGNVTITAGTMSQIANGTVSLTASATNYLVALKSTGAVSVSTATTNWNDTGAYWRLYSIVTGASSVTSYTDAREFARFSGADGDVVGPAASVDNEIALFSGVTGRAIKRATTTGLLKATSGVMSAASAGTDFVAPGGALGTPSSGTLTSCTGLPVSTGISGLGTGVATALAVNVGTAGAPVVNGGVLGTPSSGTVTNLTGTASININGTVGATTPAAGTFTTLTSTGNVTIGDAEATDTHAIKGATTLLANSASAALTVTQTGAGNAFVVEDSASTDATPFVIDSEGRLVAGDDVAETKVQWFGATYIGPRIQAVGTAQSTGASISVGNFSSTPSTDGALYFYKSASDTVGTATVVTSGAALGTLSFNGCDGTNYIRAATIQGFCDGTPGTNDMPGRLVFSTTADGASSPTERMRIDSAGLITIAAGQIKFPATQNASADANTLDDYREGTFTPVLSDGTNNATASSAIGRYTKIGRIVTIEIGLTTSALGSVTGNLRITGLPFANSSSTSIPMTIVPFSGLALPAGVYSLACSPQSGGSYINIYTLSATSGVEIMQASEWSDDGSVRIAGTYYV